MAFVRTFFEHFDRAYGPELWITGGTPDSTRLVKDILPGSLVDDLAFVTFAGRDTLLAGAIGGPFAVNLGGTLLFMANDFTHGQELWRSDGTDAGTSLVTDLNFGFAASTPAYLTNIGGTLYFSADDGQHGRELFRTDGTAGGTSLVLDINPGGFGSDPQALTNVNGNLYFTADDGVHGRELWRSINQPGGTAMVADLNANGSAGSNPKNLTADGSTLYFTANNGVGNHTDELWAAVGTTVTQLTNVNGADAGIGHLTPVGSTLYFTAFEGSHHALLKTDGTPGGTGIVFDNIDAFGLINVNNKLDFFVQGGNGLELWTTNGTQGGTLQIATPGGGSSEIFLGEGTEAVVGTTLYFINTNGIDPTAGQLWKSDGTPAGTMMVKDFGLQVLPAAFENVNGLLYFNTETFATGITDDLWVSDGTSDGTHMLWDNTGLGVLPQLGFVTDPGQRMTDLNGDGHSDVLLRNDDGRVSLWQMNGLSLVKGVTAGTPLLDSTWHNVDTGDFNRDTFSDLLLRNDDGRLTVWEMNGASLMQGATINSNNLLDNTWHNAGTGDFNTDGNADILLRNDDGRISIWEMDGVSLLQALTINPSNHLDATWHNAGTGDFNGDGHADILLRNDDGRVSIWEMNGFSLVQATTINPTNQLDPSWHIAGTGDFNADGNADILLRNDDGRLSIWEMDGLAVLQALTINPSNHLDPTWHNAGTGDFNGDGYTDILLRNDDGRVSIWEMNGFDVVLASTVNPGNNLDPTWHVANHQADLSV